VARDLALRGVDVTLVERGGLSAGTTGRSHGVLHSGGRYADTDPEGARECIRENRILREIAGNCIADTGGLFVATADDDPSYLDEKAAACEDCGIPTERLAPATLREHAPELPEGVCGGLAVPDGVVYPSRLVAATAAGAEAAGATVRTHTPATDVLTDGGAVAGVRVATDGADAGGDASGIIRADHVVNATGAWAGHVAGLAGVELPMRPTRGAMVVVDRPASAVLNRGRPPGDGDIVVPCGDRAILGTTSVAVENPESFDRPDAEVGTLVEACRALLPGLTREEVVRSYWGLRPIPASAGAGRDASRGFALVDHATDGVTGLTSIVGGKLTTHRLMAEAVADHVCAGLGVHADCATAETPLPGADDPAELDRLVEAFDAGSPADATIVDGADAD
jgi:glycerol-3-phosphate dehydrogenase